MTLLKPKLLEFILTVYFNQEKPLIDSILRQASGFTEFFRFEKERLSDFTQEKLPASFMSYLFNKVLQICAFYKDKVIVNDAAFEYKYRNDYK